MLSSQSIYSYAKNVICNFSINKFYYLNDIYNALFSILFSKVLVYMSLFSIVLVNMSLLTILLEA